MSTSSAFPTFTDLAAAQSAPGGATPSAQPAASVVPVAAPAVTATPVAAVAPPQIPPPAAVSTNAMIRRLEASGTLNPGHGFTDDMQVLEYLAVQQQPAQEPTSPAAQPPQPATGGMPAPSHSELAAAAAALQQSGMLTFEAGTGVWKAVSPLAATVANAMNENVARQRAVMTELSDPQAFIRNYGADAFSEFIAPLQTQIQQLTDALQQQRQMLAANAPDPGKEFVAANSAALKNPDGSLTAAGQAYSQAWDAAARAGVRNREAAHDLAFMAARPLMPTPAAQTVPAAPSKQTLPWSSTIPTTAVNPTFSAPGPLTTSGPAPLGVPVNNAGFPDFTAMAAQRAAGTTS